MYRRLLLILTAVNQFNLPFPLCGLNMLEVEIFILNCTDWWENSDGPCEN